MTRRIVGEERKKNGRRCRKAACSRTGEHGRDVAEIRSENVNRTVAELSAWRHERQVEVNVDT